MTNLIVISLILLCVGIVIVMIWCDKLDKKIVELENRICATQLQIDDALEDISIVNRNVLNTYSILIQIKEKQNENYKV